jgi:hypothetical protein
MRRVIAYLLLLVVITGCTTTKYARDLRKKSRNCDCEKIQKHPRNYNRQ